MTKEKLFEELLAKRSAADQPQSSNLDNGDTVWHETGGLNVQQLKIGKLIIDFTEAFVTNHFPIVSWTIAGILSVVGLISILAIVLCICYCIKNKNKKKQHAFGIKKAYFKDRKPPARNPTPVSNPSKGHYLKKSPSPTGHKSPPGTTIVESIEESQKKPLLHGNDVVDHHSAEGSSMRRSSSGHIMESVCGSISSSSTDANQVLGTLHCTIRYSFEKNALVVTVNRCENLPAKDTAAKSRYVIIPRIYVLMAKLDQSSLQRSICQAATVA